MIFLKIFTLDLSDSIPIIAFTCKESGDETSETGTQIDCKRRFSWCCVQGLTTINLVLSVVAVFLTVTLPEDRNALRGADATAELVHSAGPRVWDKKQSGPHDFIHLNHQISQLYKQFGEPKDSGSGIISELLRMSFHIIFGKIIHSNCLPGLA